MALTADGLTGSEDLGDLRVHVDHHILFCFDLVVALLHLSLYPLGKRSTHDGIYDIGDVLPRQLVHLLFDGKVAGDARIRVAKG